MVPSRSMKILFVHRMIGHPGPHVRVAPSVRSGHTAHAGARVDMPGSIRISIYTTMCDYYDLQLYVVCARAPDHIASRRLARAARSRGLQLSCATALDIGHDSCRTGCARQDTSRENATPNYRLNVVCHAATWSPIRPPEVLPHEPIAIYIAIRSDSLSQPSAVTQAYTLNGLREILDCQ